MAVIALSFRDDKSKSHKGFCSEILFRHQEGLNCSQRLRERERVADTLTHSLSLSYSPSLIDRMVDRTSGDEKGDPKTKPPDRLTAKV